MSYPPKYLYLILISILSSYTLNSQIKDFTIPDSLKHKSFYELEDKVYDTSIEKKQILIYAKSYLKKALNINDSVKIATGYLFLTVYFDNEQEFEKYIDLAINYSKNKVSFLVPSTAYSMKAGIYSGRNNHKKALDYYSLSHKAALKGNNFDLAYMMTFNIGLLNNRIGNHDEAIKHMKQTWKHFENSEFPQIALSSMCIIANSYTYKKKTDSASYINKLGIDKSLLLNDLEHYNFFTFYEGINKYYQNNIPAARDSILKALPDLIKTKNHYKVPIAYSYLGKMFHKQKEKTKSLEYLKKVDSIFNIDNDLPIYCRDTYRLLIDTEKAPEKQLYYLNQLLKLDSILHNNFRYLTKSISNEYEIPKLLSKKEALILMLDKKNKSNIKKNYILIFLVSVLSLSLVVLYYLKRRKENSFKKLINDLNSKEENKSQKKRTDLKINEKIVIQILKNLEDFEEKNEFLSKKISLQNLAKKLNTNSKYLSKVINTHKHKTFKNYINDLRVNYVINLLKHNSKYRNFTVKALAEEVGFSNTESFSKAFRKRTNLSVVYFIKKIDALNKKN